MRNGTTGRIMANERGSGTEEGVRGWGLGVREKEDCCCQLLVTRVRSWMSTKPSRLRSPAAQLLRGCCQLLVMRDWSWISTMPLRLASPKWAMETRMEF